MSESSEERLYPIKLVYHRNRYASVLLDVNGNELIGETGAVMNVFKEEMKDMLVERKIRCIHYMKREPTYIYFVINQEQAETFQLDRDHGSAFPNRCYHVYLDD